VFQLLPHEYSVINNPQVYDTEYLRPPETEIVGSNPSASTDVCPRFACLRVDLCEKADPPVQEVIAYELSTRSND
jgi:hypothetical protein